MAVELFSKADIDRFWSKVDVREEHECWLWKASCFETGGGYGQFQVKHESIPAHRFSLMLKLDRRLLPGEQSLHDCPGGDNPKCVNPKHLWLGSNDDNMEDMVRKGRSCKGERSGQSKLFEKDVREIISLWKTGNYTKSALSRIFGVSDALIGSIIRKKAWSHLWADQDIWPVKTEGRHVAYFGIVTRRSSLTNELVLEIRKLWEEGGRTYTEIGLLYGVGYYVISAIVNRRTWRHLD